MEEHPSTWPGRGLLAAAVVLAALTAPVAAQQDSVCTWDRCALRVHQGFFGARLVRGMTGEKVAGLGLFPPALPLLAERSDSAAVRYDAFRSKQAGGGILTVAGLALSLAGLIALLDDSQEAGSALSLAGVALTTAGAIVISTGQNDLSRAVWWYNRTLATNEPPPGQR